MTGMKILRAWGGVNVGVGAVGWAESGRSDKYFYQMNTFWGVINTGVAYLGYRSAQRKITANLSAAEISKAQKKTEKIFLFNSGLDLAYIGAGAYLQNHGNQRNDAKLKGYGASVILQGIFLTLFDATLYQMQRSHGRKLKQSF